jgi:hypothetical protein
MKSFSKMLSSMRKQSPEPVRATASLEPWASPVPQAGAGGVTRDGDPTAPELLLSPEEDHAAGAADSDGGLEWQRHPGVSLEAFKETQREPLGHLTGAVEVPSSSVPVLVAAVPTSATSATTAAAATPSPPGSSDPDPAPAPVPASAGVDAIVLAGHEFGDGSPNGVDLDVCSNASSSATSPGRDSMALSDAAGDADVDLDLMGLAVSDELQDMEEVEQERCRSTGAEHDGPSALRVYRRRDQDTAGAGSAAGATSTTTVGGLQGIVVHSRKSSVDVPLLSEGGPDGSDGTSQSGALDALTCSGAVAAPAGGPPLPPAAPISLSMAPLVSSTGSSSAVGHLPLSGIGHDVAGGHEEPPMAPPAVGPVGSRATAGVARARLQAPVRSQHSPTRGGGRARDVAPPSAARASALQGAASHADVSLRPPTSSWATTSGGHATAGGYTGPIDFRVLREEGAGGGGCLFAPCLHACFPVAGFLNPCR